MRNSIAFVFINGIRLEIQSYIPGWGMVERRINEDKLTVSSRRRLQAYVLLRDWTYEEDETWHESDYGYDYTEYVYFELAENGRGDFVAKRWLLYLLMDDDERVQYDNAQYAMPQTEAAGQ